MTLALSPVVGQDHFCLCGCLPCSISSSPFLPAALASGVGFPASLWPGAAVSVSPVSRQLLFTVCHSQLQGHSAPDSLLIASLLTSVPHRNPFREPARSKVFTVVVTGYYVLLDSGREEAADGRSRGRGTELCSQPRCSSCHLLISRFH